MYISKNLTAKERLFCSVLLETGNVKKAAEKACIDDSRAEKLLGNENIVNEIERLAALKKRVAAALSICGYTKLAFGTIADAVSLLYTENPSLEKLNEMDLFTVAEVKKPKNEAMEIKFCDRMKALERLENYVSEDDGTKSLFDAISGSARALAGDKDGN